MTWWEELQAAAKRALGGIQGTVSWGGGQPPQGSVVVGQYPGPSWGLVGIVLVVLLVIVLWRR